MTSTMPFNQAECDRRYFLQLAGTGALALIAGCHGGALSAYDPWTDVLRRPDAHENPGRAIIAAGILAPSTRNTQPWKFKLFENRILVFPDYTRQLLVCDPSARELTISLGCAIENITIAANACGRQASVEYLEASGKDQPLAAIDFGTELAQPPTLSDVYVPAIANRHTNRSPYQSRAIEQDKLQMLANVGSTEGVRSLLLSQEAKDQAAQISGAALFTLNKSEAYLREKIYWSRYSGKEINRKRDGLAMVHSRVGWPESCFARFVMTTFDNSEEQELRERGLIGQSPAAILIAGERDDPFCWLDVGRCYCRLALAATAMDLKNQPHNSAILLDKPRGELSEISGESKYKSQMLIRLGYAGAEPHSPRRSIEDVIESG
jgi:nitroreductase